MELTPIFIVGFIILGIYKLFELFVKKKERLALIDKLPAIINNNNAENATINVPSISLINNDYYGSWSLRISLLLIGIGLGCILSLVFQSREVFADMLKNAQALGYSRDGLLFLFNFAFISFIGGLGLFCAYLIEANTAKEKKDSLS